MKRRRAPALLAVLLPALVALNGCGGGENINNANANNANANTTGTNVNANSNFRTKIDEALAKMTSGSANFNPPRSMKLGEEKVLTFVITPDQTPGELVEQARKESDAGSVDTHTIRISNEMQPRLEGRGFHIEPEVAEVKPVVKLQQTKWEWTVRPERAGELSLALYLSAIEDLGDGPRKLPGDIMPYNPRRYYVSVAAPPRSVWTWLLAALPVPAGGVAAWLWLRRRKRRRAAPQWFVPGVGESRIFLSYRREEAAGHAGRLRDALVERFGAGRVFMDMESIRGGDDFVDALEKAVASCAVVVAVIGRQWVSATDREGRRRLDNPNDFVRLEVEAALKRGVRVIPALVQGAEMPGADVLPAPLAKLARRNAVEISDSRWAFDVERLASIIEEALEHEPGEVSEPSTLPG